MRPARRRRPALLFPLCLTGVAAGFPSPADDHIEKQLDLTEHLVRHPDATFFMRARGHSMTDVGILDGALLIVDRSIEPVDGRIVVAQVEGNLAVKRLRRTAGRTWLESASSHQKYPPIEVTDPDALIWGVVISSINTI
jgi:DNA polymerase V